MNCSLWVFLYPSMPTIAVLDKFRPTITLFHCHQQTIPVSRTSSVIMRTAVDHTRQYFRTIALPEQQHTLHAATSLRQFIVAVFSATRQWFLLLLFSRYSSFHLQLSP